MKSNKYLRCGAKTLRGDTLKPYEKLELPDARMVDASLIDDGYKNFADGIEGVQNHCNGFENRSK